MITLFDLFFWLYFVFFIIAIFFAFFVPGDLFLKKIPLSLFQRIVLGVILGLVLWAYQGLIFGYLNARWLSYVYLSISFVLWLKFNFTLKRLKLIKNLNFKNLDFLLLILIFLGTSIQLLSIWFNGIQFSNGLYFCCDGSDSGGSDILFHLALTNELTKRFPPFEPGMWGVAVENYHYLTNLVVAELIRVFKLPIIATQYQYFTLLISILLGLSAVVFAQILKLRRNFSRFLVFFLYFSGDFIFLIIFALGRGLNFNLTLLENATSLWLSPPRVFSMVVIFAGITMLYLWSKKKDVYTGILLSLILGSLVGFKTYEGIFALSGLVSLGIYYLFKKYFQMMAPIILALIISLTIYLPVNKEAGGLFFSGFWRFENFIVQPELGLSRLELARRIYLSHNSWLRVAQYEAIFALFYILSLCGPFLIGLIQTKKTLQLFAKPLNIFLISGLITNATLGFFFLQKTGGANTSQFLFSIYYVGSLYAALACCYFLGKIHGKIKLIFIILIVLIAIPRVVHQSFINLGNIVGKIGFFIDKEEVAALSYIRNNTEKNSYVLIDNKRLRISNRSYYFNFLADRPMFIGGIGILKDHGVDVDDRLKISDAIFESKDESLVYRSLLKNNIDYIYMSGADNLGVEESTRFLKKVYDNNKIKILRVVRGSG